MTKTDKNQSNQNAQTDNLAASNPLGEGPALTHRKKKSPSPDSQNPRKYSLFKNSKPVKGYELCEIPSSSRRRPPGFLENRLRRRLMRPKFMAGKNQKKGYFKKRSKIKAKKSNAHDKRRTKSGEFASTNINSNPILSFENGFHQQQERALKVTKNLSSISNFEEAEQAEGRRLGVRRRGTHFFWQQRPE